MAGISLRSSILGLALVVIACQALPNSPWSHYKKRYGKSFVNTAEELIRRQNFDKRSAEIERFNALESEKAGYIKGVNHLTDWTEEELAMLNGFRAKKYTAIKGNENDQEAKEFLDNLLNDEVELPKEVDWRKVPGRVSPVKDQGKTCGSCWAFATTGLLEGQEMAQVKQSRQLSEQNLIDCSKANGGCQGGEMSNALLDIRTIIGGIEDENDYPYEGLQEWCRFNKTKSVMSDKNSIILPEGDELALQKAVARYGPVAVGLTASDAWFDYKSGLLTDTSCDKEDPNHGVLVVGYGVSESGEKYWIVKNSWSTDWGMDGYVMLPRDKGNRCHVASHAVLATF